MDIAAKVMASAGLCAITLLACAGGAAADPAKPTDYRSRVVRVTPSAPAISVQVVGGDGFLELDVRRGHQVVVPSTADNSPAYLRFLADGTVERNQLSVNTYLNASRQGGSAVPAEALAATAATAPRWTKVATSGQWAWHDHRIHWMGRSRPPSLRGATGRVDMGGPGGAWSVALIVDGRPVTVRGTLVLEQGESPWRWLAVVVVAACGTVVLARRHPAVACAACTFAAGAALVVGIGQNRAIPAGGGADPLTVALPAVALLATVVGVALRRPGTWVLGVLAAAATVGVWALNRVAVLWNSVLPTTVDFDLDRLGTSLAFGLVVGAGAMAVSSGAWQGTRRQAVRVPRSGG